MSHDPISSFSQESEQSFREDIHHTPLSEEITHTPLIQTIRKRVTFGSVSIINISPREKDRKQRLVSTDRLLSHVPDIHASSKSLVVPLNNLSSKKTMLSTSHSTSMSNNRPQTIINAESILQAPVVKRESVVCAAFKVTDTKGKGKASDCTVGGSQQPLSVFGFSEPLSSKKKQESKSVGKKRKRDEFAVSKDRNHLLSMSVNDYSEYEEYVIDEPLYDAGSTNTDTILKPQGSFSQFEILPMSTSVSVCPSLESESKLTNPYSDTEVSLPWVDVDEEVNEKKCIIKIDGDSGFRDNLFDQSKIKSVSFTPVCSSLTLISDTQQESEKTCDTTPSPSPVNVSYSTTSTVKSSDYEEGKIGNTPKMADSIASPSAVPIVHGIALICDLCRFSEALEAQGMIICKSLGTCEYKGANYDILPDWYVVHISCALWSPLIYYDEDVKSYKGVADTVELSSQIKCMWCRKPGASIGCIENSCQRSYHRHCALLAGSTFDEENFQMACPKHRSSLLPTHHATITHESESNIQQRK